MDRLNAMRAFVRTVEMGSFSRAAADLRVSQSTVSKWVAALEMELGTTLLRRTTRAQQLTDAGQRMYDTSRTILSEWEAAQALLHGASSPLTGRLRVTVPTVFGERFVVPLVSSFVLDNPQVQVELVLDDRYLPMVNNGFDVAIRVGTPIDSTLKARTLARTPRRLVACTSYLASSGPLAHPRDLANHQGLQHTLTQPSVWTFSQGDDVVRAQITGRIAANHSASLLTLAQQGHGIALVASWLADPLIETGVLVHCLPQWAAPIAPVQALTATTQTPHPRIRAFIDHVREHLTLPGQLGAP